MAFKSYALLSILVVGAGAAASLVTACDNPGDTFLDITYDPCEPIVLVPQDDASAAEIAAIDRAIDMWNVVYATRLTRDDAPDAARLPIRFEDGALTIRGVYQDEYGDIIINRGLTDPHDMAVTIAHELGHALGLWHVPESERDSVMNAGNLEYDPTPADAAKVAELWGTCPPSLVTHGGVASQ